MITISQCMIVKNEEQNIRRALEWAKDIVCEQIVVDTGSIDDTIGIAQEMGAKVYRFTWNNDFAAAKNYAIEQATGEWIAFLDADEYLIKEDADKLPDILERINGKSMDIVRTNWLNINQKGDVFGVFEQDRFFRNDKDIKYEGKIHEALVSSTGRQLCVMNMQDTIRIFHTGYAWTQELRKTKSIRNEKMIKELLKETDDSWVLKTYADALLVGENLEGAKEYIVKALEKNDGLLDRNGILDAYQMMLSILLDLAIKEKKFDYDEFERYYEKAKKIDEFFPDFDMIYGFWEFERKNWEECIKYLERAISLAEKQMELIKHSRIYAKIGKIYSQLAICYGKLNQIRKSIYYASLTLQARPYEENILCQLITLFIDYDGAKEEDVVEYLKKIYDFRSQKNILFISKMALTVEKRKLCELVLEYAKL